MIEIEEFVYVKLPEIRKYLTLELRKRKITMLKVGEIMGVSKVAISQYVNNKRVNRELLTKKERVFLGKEAKELDNIEQFKKIVSKMLKGGNQTR